MKPATGVILLIFPAMFPAITGGNEIRRFGRLFDETGKMTRP